MFSVYRNATSFKLFWFLVAIFASLNALLVAAEDKPYEPASWVGGLPYDRAVHNQIYNITWGGSTKPSNISVRVAQMPDVRPTSGSITINTYPLVENITDNPYAWNLTLPVGTTWWIEVCLDGARSGFASREVHVLSKASSASKLLVTGASTLGFMLLALVALIHL